MSKTSTLEHIWMPPHQLPATLGHLFKDGVCAVFEDEDLLAAIPASNDDTNKLADLAELWAIAPARNDPAWKEYCMLRDARCHPLGIVNLTKVFKQEMDKLKVAQEKYDNATNERYLKLASAARPKRIENN